MTGQVIAHFTNSIQAVKDVSFLPVTAFYDSIDAQPLSPMAQTQSWEHEAPLFPCIFRALFWTSSQRWPSVQPAFLNAQYARWQQENGAFGSSAVGWVKTYTLVISATLIAHNFIFNRLLQRCPFFKSHSPDMDLTVKTEIKGFVQLHANSEVTDDPFGWGIASSSLPLKPTL